MPCRPLYRIFLSNYAFIIPECTSPRFAYKTGTRRDETLCTEYKVSVHKALSLSLSFVVVIKFELWQPLAPKLFFAEKSRLLTQCRAHLSSLSSLWSLSPLSSRDKSTDASFVAVSYIFFATRTIIAIIPAIFSLVFFETNKKGEVNILHRIGCNMLMLMGKTIDRESRREE